ncbi:unnamed protein product [Dibothriocephalus latus]|uniref:Sphingomyelin synthase-like domain-containing protein n=1 Tax=Dibothriocephalus latus TaxID=60516 RepID=A0A3P7RGD8_DIBLA|nr:unnamed protein product [Dibothriocephalus latus]
MRKRILFLIDQWRSYEKHQQPLSIGEIPSLAGPSDGLTGATMVHPLASTSSGRTKPDQTYDLNFPHRERVNLFEGPVVHGRLPGQSESYSVCESNPKLWKVAVSALYAMFSFSVTAFVMVLVHERLPEMSKYPPLPDILLDNLPYIPWAFEAAEIVAVALLAIWLTILVFHRHRFILLRRYCSLLGTVFLLRSVTMFITSLSAPGRHLSTECKPFVFHSFSERLRRAAEIFFGLGMTLRGVRTCGDYIFSGHTAVITMLNFFITEYTPPSFHPLHIFTWILNVFGIFFILAAHEHYSIDVFVAVYITSRLFLYYHWLANNQFLMRQDKQRARIWFPLFTFFESDSRGAVPAEFSNPFQGIFQFLKCRLLPRHVSSILIPPRGQCYFHEKGTIFTSAIMQVNAIEVAVRCSCHPSNQFYLFGNWARGVLFVSS